jgi:class I fructose-bisphosphate aldolase/fructose-bisphosphate aldolase/2-amino-3,7-dideoxy-D-threo-hept-6-ulosonate synthase
MPTGAKILRLSRFFYPDRRAGVIVPIDHGLTLGPIPGIERVSRIAAWIRHPAITGIIAHKGMVERLSERGLLQGRGVMIHVNGMSSRAPEPDTKEIVTTVETAVRLGADAISVQVNFDGRADAHNLKLLGRVVDDALRYNLPVLAMVYDATAASRSTEERIERQAHFMRIAVELGIDALKIGLPEKLEHVATILRYHAADTPVFFAGGERTEDSTLRTVLAEALRHGGAGLCVGRNVFQRENPAEILQGLHDDIMRAAPTADAPL